MLPRLAALAAAAALVACATPEKLVPRTISEEMVRGTISPTRPAEFRGAWVATVANIDWPSRKDLTVAEQQREMRAIVERAAELKLNALILQVRPSADAIYPSALEPWSEYLTGEQGRAPDPPYDPLKEWIDEAHARGIELHAWFNPYRARHSNAQSYPAPNHVANTQPAIVKLYGDQLWMDPGEPAAAGRTLAVILDVVRRYDVDGVHIDDYFYPYPVGTPEIDFPDDESWGEYVSRGGILSKADWRRENVNALVERINREVHIVKPRVRFGVSPFGLGRPDRRPPGVEGFSQYDKIYADVELWLRSCWMDYLVPQLYWPLSDTARPFGVLLDYWIGENACGREIYAGLFTSRLDAGDICEQIRLTRSRSGASGHVHFSMQSLMKRKPGSDPIFCQAENGV